MNTVQQVIILSAERFDNRMERNRQLTANLEGYIDELRLDFKRAEGVYKGTSETSFVVVVNTQDEIDVLKNLAFKVFGQESILHQDSNQQAYLIFADGSTQELGKLRQVSKEQAESQDAYTIMENKYYLAG